MLTGDSTANTHTTSLPVPPFNKDDLYELRQLLLNARQPAVRSFLSDAISSVPVQESVTGVSSAEKSTTTRTTAADLSSNTHDQQPSQTEQRSTQQQKQQRSIATRILSSYSWAEDSKKATVYVTLPTSASSAQKQPDWDETPKLRCGKREADMEIVWWTNHPL
jgi:DNA polymerase III gamma/tau subunit